VIEANSGLTLIEAIFWLMLANNIFFAQGQLRYFSSILVSDICLLASARFFQSMPISYFWVIG